MGKMSGHATGDVSPREEHVRAPLMSTQEKWYTLHATRSNLLDRRRWQGDRLEVVSRPDHLM